jgi:trehalose-phosphatase
VPDSPLRRTPDRDLIDPVRIRAVILDMDGVITDTARLHEAAWKETFDPMLSEHGRQAPFSTDDYLRHVDGKRREDGVRDFLAARGITLPEGARGDAASRNTVRGVARRKDQRFKALLERGGATAYPDTMQFIDRLQHAGIRVAAISASRNADAVLEAAGVRDRFAVLIDGRVAAERALTGKPAPDVFLEAARALGIEPAHAAIAEDSLAGVEAGRRGGFALVIGVARNGDADALGRAGADVVVSSFDRMWPDSLRRRTALPDALTGFDTMMAARDARPLRVFLDYDGTLTPIVSRPEDAVLGDAMRSRLQNLAGRHFLAVVSGRGLDDLRARIGLDGVVYAGSHGFEVRHPDGRCIEHAEAHATLPVLDGLAARLESALGSIDGLQLERKRFGLAVHYRRVQDPGAAAEVERVVDAARARFDTLTVKAGKKVFEFVPAIEWDKGRALRWILDDIDGGLGHALPLYVGDDVTDEDAFRAVDGVGVGIAVGDGPEHTAARWKLDDVGAVGTLLDRLATLD